MKKFFLIFLLMGIVAGIFFVVKKNIFKETEERVVDNKSTEIVLQEEQKEPIIVISKSKAIGIFIDKENDRIRYFSPENGILTESDFDGRNVNIISEGKITKIDFVEWSYSGKSAILKSGDSYYYFNIESGEYMELKKGIDTVSWSQDGLKIFYKFFNSQTKERTINVADPSGENELMLSKTELKDVKIAAIPQSISVSFWNKPKYNEETSLKKVSNYGGDSEEIFTSKKGADYSWSPNGKMAFISFSKDASGESLGTGLIKNDGSYTELNIPTLASKMIWSEDNKNFYYALPISPQGSKMPDDYDSGKITTLDTFWKVNVESGQNERLVELGAIKTALDVTELKTSSSNRSLFFINKKDGLVYRLDF